VGINTWLISNKINHPPYAQHLPRYTTENNNQTGGLRIIRINTMTFTHKL